MIILDLTNIKNKSPLWPKTMPKKIRLTPGKYDYLYDFHPMVLKTRWYRELINNHQKKFPDKRKDWPMGLSEISIERYNLKIIKD